MKFEEAMKEMRKGKKIVHSGRSVALSINENGDIVENYKTFTEELQKMNVCNIMREDWVVVNE